MLPAHADRILSLLGDTDLVLDVGAWACPFNRAQYVLDAQPWSTRGFYRTFGGPPSQGGDREWFTEATWIRRDICAREPWPFADRQFDFAICSHTLEDIRDPLWVCAELMRVARRGYIEVPSREYECCLGLERPLMAGLSHHRWLIDIEGQHIRFLQKLHMIHADRRFALPARHARRLTPERAVTWLWWEGAFTVSELDLHGLGDMQDELMRFVNTIRPPSPALVALDDAVRFAWRAARSARRRLPAWPASKR